MWEVKNYKEIMEEHLSTFKILKKYHQHNRLIMLYGNHDIFKRDSKVLKKYFYKHNNNNLLNNLKVEEALILNYQGKDICLIHGHQVDFLNGIIWPVAHLLVRHIWRHLENYGIKSPTNSAKNYKVAKRVEKKLKKWTIKNKKILISGHTHRPIFPKVGQGLYFNDGSCIHPNGITCLEIENGNITLVKWKLKLENYKFISIGREVITPKQPIINYYL